MNESDIERLLRQQAPDIPVRPCLEARIHAALRHQRRHHFALPWLALPTATLLALAVYLGSGVRREQPAPPAIAVSVPESDLDRDAGLAALNPLGNEAKALRQDAERTGRFLINCLPSLSVAER